MLEYRHLEPKNIKNTLYCCYSLEFNHIYSACVTEPNDPNYGVQWALNNIGQGYPAGGPGTEDCDIDAPEAWDIHTGSSDTIVAVVDSGVDYNHRDLAGNVWINQDELNGDPNVDDDDNGYIDDVYGYDFVNDDNDPMDDSGHGTHCAGIISARGNNGLDIAGVSWNAKIMALKFLSGGTGPTVDAAEAIYYAANPDNGADIISNSWGGGPYNETLESAINYAHALGLIQVAAAGNEGSNTPQYPANYEHMIAVASTDSNDDKAVSSNYGQWVDLAAPGVDILSLRAYGTSMGSPQNDYLTVASGTSMACPHVSGGCALLLSVDPILEPSDVREILKQTGDAIADGICDSNSRLNVFEAMYSLNSSKGYIRLDEDYYSCASDEPGILVVDQDLENQSTQDVNIVTSGGDFETVTLTEDSNILGRFEGTIIIDVNDPNTQDGKLQISHDEIITATYEDANDGSGSPASPNDTAAIDCNYPVISSVQVDANGPVPKVIFETDEYTFCFVQVSDDPCLGSYSSHFSSGTNHTVGIKGLNPVTEYYFKIEATDYAGNETVDNNDGNYYTFTTDSPGDIYVPSEFTTIQEAASVAWSGSTIWVDEGTYYGFSFQPQKDLVVTSYDPNGPNVVGNTIIVGSGACAVGAQDSNGANWVLTGFTIKDANQEGSLGGVLCEKSSPTIIKCHFTRNKVGVKCGNEASSLVSDCEFYYNQIAISCPGPNTTAEIENNLIYDNTFGIDCGNDASEIRNNLIYENDFGIQVKTPSNYSVIRNNTIVNNSSYGIRKLPAATPTATISNCILWGNDYNDLHPDFSATYSCIEDCNDANGVGNICGDANNPLFVDDVNDDYHLGANSPCIDAGDPNGDYDGQVDIDGMMRVVDGTVDIGADELDCFPSDHNDYDMWVKVDKPECWCERPSVRNPAIIAKYQCKGDADGNFEGADKDGKRRWVVLADLDILNAGWQKVDTDPNFSTFICADFDHNFAGPDKDGKRRHVVLNDLDILTAHWQLPESDPNMTENPCFP